MAQAAITRLSSDGQIILPEELCRRMDLEPGTQFAVTGEGGVIVLKALSAPPRSGLRALPERAPASVNEAALGEADASSAPARS